MKPYPRSMADLARGVAVAVVNAIAWTCDRAICAWPNLTNTDEETPVSTTNDRNDPGLSEIGPDGMQKTYLVLSDEERAKGFVRPLRRSYKHLTCGTVTTMGLAIAETYARDPQFYGGTYCAGCRNHFPVGQHGEFVWDGTTEKVGT